MRDIQFFLKQTAWRDAAVHPLKGDASFRHYARLMMGRETAIVMDAPPPMEQTEPFIKMAAYLRSINLSCPRLYHQDTEQGFLVLEDLGDALFSKILLQDPAREESLYQLAVDTLLYLQQQPNAPDIPAYTREKLLSEVALFTEWALPTNTAESMHASWLEVWDGLLSHIPPVPPVLVLRDYHVDNLLLLPREGIQACGLLDFQDAVVGHPAYDVVSLLQDARRNVSKSVIEDCLAYYLKNAQVDPNSFMTAYYILGTQRAFKIIGIFNRLFLRDKKPIYLQHIPRVWRYIHANLEQPALKPLKQWLDAQGLTHA